MSTQLEEAPDQRELLDRLRIDHADEAETRGQGLVAVLAFGVAVLLVAAVYFFWPSASSVETEPVAPAVDAPVALTAAPAAIDGLSASGYVTARRQATVSAELTGRVAEVLIEEGMSVQVGQVLARLDSTLAKIDLGVAEGHLQAARGALALVQAERVEARLALGRVRDLKAQHYASLADGTRSQASADGAEARFILAQGNLAAAEQSLNRTRALLDKHDIRAPFAGVVTAKDAQPGEIVSPAAAGGGFTRTGICTIVDMNSLEVEVEVNESFIARVKPGQKATATLDAYPERAMSASVSAIIPTANRDRATVKVRVAIDTPDARMLPEMAAKVVFSDELKSGFATSDASQRRGHGSGAH